MWPSAVKILLPIKRMNGLPHLHFLNLSTALGRGSRGPVAGDQFPVFGIVEPRDQLLLEPPFHEIQAVKNALATDGREGRTREAPAFPVPEGDAPPEVFDHSAWREPDVVRLCEKGLPRSRLLELFVVFFGHVGSIRVKNKHAWDYL
jgi:hypothetical protein